MARVALSHQMEFCLNDRSSHRALIIMILTIDHVQVAMPAGREADARQFYGMLLGLPELEKPEALKSRGGVWFGLADGRQLHLGVEQDFHPNRKAHPCFVVDGEYEALARLLEESGYSIQHDGLNPSVRRFYAHDPFGNRLEFADRRSSG